MAEGVSGDLKLGLDLEVASAEQSLKRLTKTIADSMNTGDKSVDVLNARLGKTTNKINDQIKKLEDLKSKLNDLESGNGEVKGTAPLQKQLEKTREEIEKTKAKLAELKAQEASTTINIPAQSGVGVTGQVQAQPSGKGSEVAKIQSEIASTEKKLAELEQKATETSNKLKEAFASGTQSEIETTKNKIQQTSDELKVTTANAEQLQQKLKDKTIQSNVDSIGNAFTKLGSRILGLAKRIFVFSLITSTLRGVRTAIGNVMAADAGLQASFNALQSSAWTAFAPILQVAIPALQSLVTWITAALNVLAQFIALISGKSYTSMQKAGEAYQKQAKGASSAGDAYQKQAKGASKAADAQKKLNKEMDKTLAGFDEIEILESPTVDTGDTGDTGGAGGGGGAGADTASASSPIDTANLDIIEEKFKSILVLAGLIGASILAWKIYEAFTGSGAALAFLSKLLGTIMIIAGAILLVKGYSDAWVNGVGWQNLIEILAGLALVVGGIAIAVSPVAAAFVAIGGAIAMVVLGVKDFITNGPTLQNILIIITGLLVIFAATWYIASAPVAIVVTAIAALVAIFVILWNKCEGFRTFWIELWEEIKILAVDVWENYLKPTLEAIGEFFVWVWDNLLKPVIDTIVDTLTSIWNKTIKPLWENNIKPLLEAIGNFVKAVWNSVLKPVIDWVGTALKGLWDNVLKPLGEYVIGTFVDAFKTGMNLVKTAISTAVDLIKPIIDGLKTVFSGLTDFISGVFSGDWSKAWDGIKNIFKGFANGIMGFFESAINFIVKMLNKLSFKVPDWVPGIGGKKFGFDIEPVKLPKLATGAVLPPNKPFLAMVGDQKQGTNIEAPLDTIVEAMNKSLDARGNNSFSGTIEIPLILNNREVGRGMLKAIDLENARKTGTKVNTRLVFA